MDRLELDNVEVMALNAALFNDDSVNLITILNDAIATHGWPVDSRQRVGVDSCDLVAHVAAQGQPKCFEAVIKFIMEKSYWDQCSDQLRDGRSGRFAIDIRSQVENRIRTGGNVSPQQIKAELLRSFEAYLLAHDEKTIEIEAGRLSQLLGNQMSQLVANVQKHIVQGRDAKREAEDLAAAVCAAASEAPDRIKKNGRI